MNRAEKIEDALQNILDAYIERFKRDEAGRSLFGPIDEEIKAARAILRSTP